MEIKSISKETATKNKEAIKSKLKESLKTIDDLKEYLLKAKKIEEAAQLREIEKLVEKSLINFDSIEI